jgi:NAD(P)-dependent dehydrogenase (short-subunit alcohol dehydrogenase family)
MLSLITDHLLYPDTMPFTTTVITGATSGIGKETALALAKLDHAVYLLVRDTAKGEEVKQQIIAATKNKNIYVMECNLADLKSVRAAADMLKASVIGINVLINNAGGIFKNREESRNGYEMTFAVNHLGHFLLVNNLLPLLERGQARIINVSSEAHRMGTPNFNDLQWTRRPYSAFKAYGMAKLFNIYFTRSLAIKYGPKGINAFALHPGIVNTSFGSALTGIGKLLMWLMRPFMLSPERGAETTVYLATAPRLDVNSGKYFKNKRVAKASTMASNEVSRNKLWDISAQFIAPYMG